MKTDTESLTYKNLIDLQAVHLEAFYRLQKLTAELQGSFIELVDGVRAEYAELQQTLTETEASIEHIARENPTWFENSRTIKTPYGTVKFHNSTKLDSPNEEVSILLIEKGCDEETAGRYIRSEKALNLDALKELSDSQLKAFRINRISEDNCTVKPGTLDLGKAVKQADADAEKKKKAA